MTATQLAATPATRTRLAVIDADIHPSPRNDQVLRGYMPARWQHWLDDFAPRGYSGLYYPLANLHAARTDAWPPGGGPPASDLDFLRAQLLDLWQMDHGVLLPLLGVGRQLNLEFGAALASAINEWQIAEWLTPEPRLRGSIVVAFEDGDLAAAEIDRLGQHPGFVQVQVESRTAEPLGRRKYWRMYEAAVRHDLPIGMHFGAHGAWPITGVGHPSYYIEYHAGQLTSFQDQVISLIVEGVFERFPTLRFVLIEGGFGWLPPLMWRLDRAWDRLRAEAPHLTRPPSEYLRGHFWFTTQPVEEPDHAAEFGLLLDDLAMDNHIMFATDYPHWDFDAPDQAIPTTVPPALRRKIMADNARALYRF
jgi:predicted TIM-barrel fold metal-dependent hydrolase